MRVLEATALEDFQSESDRYRGHVRYSGERWNAVSAEPVNAGEQLEVQSIDGLTIYVAAPTEHAPASN